VFVSSSDVNDSYIYALDQFTGELIWRSRVGGLTMTYTASGGMLFANSTDGYIYALDQFTGELKWRYYNNNGIYDQFLPICNGMMFFVDSKEDYVYALGD
jgi:outer membrane protein assembly factor BamB